MKLITLFLVVGMFAVSGWAEVYDVLPVPPSLLKRAEAGDAKAQMELGRHLSTHGDGEAGDFEACKKNAVKWFTKSAEKGNVMAQLYLGDCYHNGEGVNRDEKEAAKWYTKSAEKGNAKAQLKLGMHYFNSLGGAEDEKEAAKWLTKSAEQSNAEA